MIFKVETGEGFSDSNSYSDIIYADEYISFYFPSDISWATKSESEKELALIMATSFVDNLLRWSGSIYNSTQALRWPRSSFRDSEGRLVEAGTIPTKIKNAVVVMALESLSNDIYDGGVLITSQEYGSSSETYAGPVRDGGNFHALNILDDFKSTGYGANNSSMITVRRA